MPNYKRWLTTETITSTRRTDEPNDPAPPAPHDALDGIQQSAQALARAINTLADLVRLHRNGTVHLTRTPAFGHALQQIERQLPLLRRHLCRFIGTEPPPKADAGMIPATPQACALAGRTQLVEDPHLQFLAHTKDAAGMCQLATVVHVLGTDQEDQAWTTGLDDGFYVATRLLELPTARTHLVSFNIAPGNTPGSIALLVGTYEELLRQVQALPDDINPE